MSDAPFWLVERYIKNTLHYWCAGAAGRGYENEWSAEFEFATRLANEESAMQVLLYTCRGEGRVVQHGMVSP